MRGAVWLMDFDRDRDTDGNKFVGSQSGRHLRFFRDLIIIICKGFDPFALVLRSCALSISRYGEFIRRRHATISFAVSILNDFG